MDSWRPHRAHRSAGHLILLAWLSAATASAHSSSVKLLRAPEGGIQPQAAMDTRGVLHLIYFKGDPTGGDIFYVQQPPGQQSFSAPMQVNSRARSAIAIGTIRGPQVALGKNGRVHVSWMGGVGAVPAMIRAKACTPMLYTRLNDAGTAFEPERNLITWAAGL